MAKKILVVEDQPEIRRLIRMTLEFEDYEISEASTATEGLATAMDLEPDLLLLDVMTPGDLDGLDVCALVKQAPGRMHRPAVILLTARGQQQDVADGLAAGADAYLLKPFSPLQLLETVKTMLMPKARA